MNMILIIYCAISGLTSGAGVLPEDSVIKSVGDSVTFNTSQAPGQTPLYYILWDFGEDVTEIILTSINGGTITEQEYIGRVSLSTFTGSLELRNLSVNDSGKYNVIMREAEGAEDILGATTLNVYEPVSDVIITANYTDLVEFNSSVSLSCSASGSSLSFLWFNDSVEVTGSDRVHFTDGGAILIISTVWRSDHGSYTCEVSNPVSSSTSDEELLFVNYGPEDVIVTTFPSDEHHVEGSHVSLSCSADSRPGAQFKWFLNGEMLPSTGAQINLVNIQMDQSGNYSCLAFNNKTLRYTTSQSSEISVFKNISDIFVKSSSDQPVEGTTLNLTCDASGSIITREWMINGLELKPLENIVFYDDKRVLSFRNLTRKDNGKYTCRLSNPVSSQSVDYTMNVKYAPKNGLSPGAIAGITVGSLVVVAGAAAGGILMFKHKKHRKQKNKSLQHVYENTSNTGNINTDEENKHVYENDRNMYDRNM